MIGPGHRKAPADYAGGRMEADVFTRARSLRGRAAAERCIDHVQPALSPRSRQRRAITVKARAEDRALVARLTALGRRRPRHRRCNRGGGRRVVRKTGSSSISVPSGRSVGSSTTSRPAFTRAFSVIAITVAPCSVAQQAGCALRRRVLLKQVFHAAMEVSSYSFWIRDRVG